MLLPPGREVAGDCVRDDPGALAGGQDGRVDAAPPHAKRRSSDHQQQHRGARGDQRGPAHHASSQPVPGTRVRTRPGSADAPAEQHQQRGHDQQGTGSGDQRDERAAEPHRDQEALREDGQAGQRCRDRGRAEHNRPAGRGQRRPERFIRAGLPLQFFAETPDQEQAVVDREPETQTDHHVHREDRQRQRRVHQAQDKQRGQYCCPADRKGQQRGDPPEDKEGEDRQQRQRYRLGKAEVCLRLLACLHPGDVRAPEQYVMAAAQRSFDIRDDRVRARRGAQRGDYQRCTAVDRDQARAVTRGGGCHCGHAGDGRDRAGSRAHGGRTWWRRDQCQHAGARFQAGGILDGLLCAGAGGAGVAERVPGVQQADGGGAERSRDQEHRERTQQHLARTADRQTREHAQHVSLPRRPSAFLLPVPWPPAVSGAHR